MTVFKLALVLTGVFFAVPAARADILFIDLNNGPGEIAAAERAAKRRGEKLIVFKGPGRRDSESSKGDDDSSPFDEKLSETLADLKRRNVKVSSVVVSGHDGNGQFFGENGDISADRLSRTFKKAEMGDNVRSLMLWGCYTGTPGALDQHWKKTMPNLNVVAGFEGSAPANTQKASADFLQDALEKEQKLSQLKDENQVQAALKQMKGGQITASALCVKDKWASNTDKFDIEQKKKDCTGKFLDDPKLQRYECYLRGKSECPNVPANTQSGELRQIYNFLQSNSICEDVLAAQDRNFPSRDTALRLIFFENIRRNLQKSSERQLDAWAKGQAKMKMPESIRINAADLVNLSRADLLSRLQKQKEFILQKQNEPGGARYNNWMRYTRSWEGLMTDNLRRFPASWVEPNARLYPRFISMPPAVPSEHYEPPPPAPAESESNTGLPAPPNLPENPLLEGNGYGMGMGAGNFDLPPLPESAYPPPRNDDGPNGR